jgi:U6 snRNA-associated Sm-like protein LSm4
MKEVIQTSAEGDKFFRLDEAYVRGNNVCLKQIGGGAVRCRRRLTDIALQIKYIRVSDDIVDTLKEQQQRDQANRQQQGRGDHQRGGFGGRGDRGGRGGRGRGRGGRGGRGS